jgi:hypothetical protein
MDFLGACRRLGAELVAVVAAARIMFRDKTGGSKVIQVVRFRCVTRLICITTG